MSIPVYAANVVSCLAVKPGEHFQALVDEPFSDVGARLCDAALAAGAASAACVVVPDSARPLLTPYEPFVASLGQTDAVCFWFMHIHDGEFAGFRKPLYSRARETGTRVAFGGRMDRSMLEHEMAADYGALRELTAALGARLTGSQRVRVTTPGGTDCAFDVTGREWKLDDGVLDQPGAFGNLPAGEVFVAPLATGAEGVCVIDRSIALGGEGLVDEPIQLTFRQGRIIAVDGGRSADSTRAAIAEAGAGADVVAELGIGTNERARITGSVITDEKVLGTAHVAFGDNASASYGGDNRAAIHVDGVMADATIEADGEIVMVAGALT
ncbi:MAG: aminopeptidase [Actinomycetota bacterium]|nr:aminopeptidase [Actinomycetota bacterium]